MNNKLHNKNAYNQNAETWSKLYSLNSYNHSHIEKPAILKALGDISKKSIIAIGCGTGEEANLFFNKGAETVGFDQSEELIKIAKKNFKEIEFFVGDAEIFIHPYKFDYAYAGFVAQYFSSWTEFLSNTSNLLKPHGELILSIVHPIKSTINGATQRINGRRYAILGSSRDQSDKSNFEVFGDYLTPHEDRVSFGENFETIQYHRPIGKQIRDILKSPFEIIDIIEPKPIESAKVDFPNKYEIDIRIPRVLIYHLRKNE